MATKSDHKKCPQLMSTKSVHKNVHKKCQQTVYQNSVHKKCLLKGGWEGEGNKAINPRETGRRKNTFEKNCIRYNFETESAQCVDSVKIWKAHY